MFEQHITKHEVQIWYPDQNVLRNSLKFLPSVELSQKPSGIPSFMGIRGVLWCCWESKEIPSNPRVLLRLLEDSAESQDCWKFHEISGFHIEAKESCAVQFILWNVHLVKFHSSTTTPTESNESMNVLRILHGRPPLGWTSLITRRRL